MKPVKVKKLKSKSKVHAAVLASEFSPEVVKEAPESAYGKQAQPNLFWEVPGRAWLVKGDCLAFLEGVTARHPDGCFDMIFADPPYFLSNGGITCHAGKMVSVNKGEWDKSKGVDEDHAFNLAWLALCQKALKPNGTIWVSGTSHVIYSIGFAMQQLGFKLLNNVTWAKTNPPPNLACRYFTHSTETILWAAKSKKSRHYFDYDLMKQINGGKQMKDVWTMPAPAFSEKAHGKHPAQKPVALLERIVAAGSSPGGLVLDPFSGSATTGVAALRLGRRYVGVEMSSDFLRLSKLRLQDAAASNELFSSAASRSDGREDS